VIDKQTEAEILRLWHAEGWRIGTIASELGIHHSVVRRVLETEGHNLGSRRLRATLADPYLPFIRETLAKHPRLRASRLFEMVKARGYPGGPDHFRAIVARVRPRPPAEAFLRLQTLPGEQAQVDWGHFGEITVGKAKRRLYGFVMTLSWSRALFLHFYLGSDNTANFLRGHTDAFAFFGGVPRQLLYDNLKSAVLQRVGDAIRFNDTLLAFAGHHRFEPRPVAIARGNEKGRVERAIRYIRDSFFAARQWRNLDDLNDQARAWCQGIAADRRCPQDRQLNVREAWAHETSHLLPLPDNPFPVEERHEVRIGKTPYARFDLNDYSVPHTHVRRTVTLLATPETVRIVDGTALIAEHARTYDRDRQIEDPTHVAALVAQKRQARQHRGMDRLQHAAPNTRNLLQLAAERGKNLGAMTAGLLKQLDLHGAAALDTAVGEAVAAGAIHLGAVRQILDRKRHEQGLPPPIPVTLPDDPRIRDLVVRPHDLNRYDSLVNPEEVNP
jgi:transposase